MKKIKLTLDKILDERGITRYWLAQATKVKHQTVTAYYRNSVVRYDSDILLRFCIALNCNIEDLITIVEE